MKSYKLFLLPGDGIGPEVVREVVRVADWFGKAGLVKFETETGLVGGCAYDAHGAAISESDMALAQAADAVLFGAVGGPKWDACLGRRGQLAWSAHGVLHQPLQDAFAALRRKTECLLAHRCQTFPLSTSPVRKVALHPRGAPWAFRVYIPLGSAHLRASRQYRRSPQRRGQTSEAAHYAVSAMPRADPSYPYPPSRAVSAHPPLPHSPPIVARHGSVRTGVGKTDNAGARKSAAADLRQWHLAERWGTSGCAVTSRVFPRQVAGARCPLRLHNH